MCVTLCQGAWCVQLKGPAMQVIRGPGSRRAELVVHSFVSSRTCPLMTLTHHSRQTGHSLLTHCGAVSPWGAGPHLLLLLLLVVVVVVGL